MIQVGIIGAAGYTGGELIRVLLQHPNAEIVFAQSSSNAGKPISSVHFDLLGDTEKQFCSTFSLQNIDVIFLCGGHGEGKKFLANNEIPASVKVIDLGNDFRLMADAIMGERKFVYGLPEINKEQISLANSIANPGCFATAIQLSLLPLAANNLLASEVYVTGITGSTGAGQSLSATSHFSWRANNIQAYKTLTHQHLGEIEQTLAQVSNANIQKDNFVHFLPWRGDFTRGIFISATITCAENIDTLNNLYQSFYHSHPFTHLSTSAISLKQVISTNKAIIQLEKIGAKLIVHTVIDNLLKGASGQAVQNMNLMFGIPETTGLMLKSVGF